MTETQNPWSIYWEGGPLNSCITGSEEKDAKAVADFWQRFAATLPHNARALDLATGNGAVPEQLLSSRPDLKITGVDSANIRPHDHVASGHPLATADFLANTNITQLPFDDGSFDAVTSQFGLEYSNCQLSVPEAARVLAPSGRLMLLVHHTDSAILRSGGRTLREINQLTLPGGVIDTVIAYVQGSASVENLEHAGERFLAEETAKTRHVSGQIFEGINQVINDRQLYPERTAALAHTMQQRLEAERERLMQLQQAARSELGATEITELLTIAGLSAEAPVAVTSGDGASIERVIIGWQIAANKK
ncbi:MAG: methyltransferase domain-containing protein [Halioglobus sp.]